MIGSILAMAALQLAMPDSAEWLRYQRGEIIGGEVWRLLSNHLIHLTWAHFVMNALGAALLCALFPRLFAPRFAVVMFVAIGLAVSLGLLAFNPNVNWYVGLSGVLHGVFVIGAWREVRSGRWDGALMLVLLALKVGWEQLYGPLPGSAETAGGPVVEDAHLYGAIAGIVFALVQFHVLPRLAAHPTS
ncbi:MAG: rhombosortase [Gammaproteobacteria bacterium]